LKESAYYTEQFSSTGFNLIWRSYSGRSVS